MKSFKKALMGVGTAAGLAIGLGTAQAAPIPVELLLAIDGSGSIVNADYDLQKNAYANVLNSALITTDGTIAVGVIQFGADVQTVFNLTLIDSQADKDALVAAIVGMNRNTLSTGATAIGDAINAALGLLAGLNHADTNQVIDVSTDGFWNFGADPVPAALAAGPNTVVNCLGVGPGANCNFETGFEILADSFADFETALSRKIAQETGQVPEPGTMLMVGLGLAGIGFMRRRKTA